MAIQTLSFATNELNISLQVGDTIYYCLTQQNQAGTNHPTSTNIYTKPKKLGVATIVDRNTGTITVDIGNNLEVDLEGHYIMFSKDRRANISGIIGYYIETELRNGTTLPAEIFAVGVDYVESSK